MCHKSRYLVPTYAIKILKETAIKMVEMELETHWYAKKLVSSPRDVMLNILIRLIISIYKLKDRQVFAY